MTADEVLTVLAYFTAAWPWQTLDEHTGEVWAEHLGGVDTADAHTAARRLVDRLERPPSIARFREECQVVARNRQPRLEPGRVDTVSRQQSARFAAALARGLQAASALIPDHDHHHGWQNCPACSTADARRPVVQAVIRREFDAEASR